MLVDLSVGGCQVLLPTILRPNQAVKVLPVEPRAVTCSGKSYGPSSSSRPRPALRLPGWGGVQPRRRILIETFFISHSAGVVIPTRDALITTMDTVSFVHRVLCGE